MDAARKALGKIDGIVINHGVLTPLARLADADVEEWRRCYDINVLSAVGLVSKGRTPKLEHQLTKCLYTGQRGHP